MKKNQIGIAICSICFIGITILVLTNQILLLDEWIYEKVMLIQNPFWDSFFPLFTKLGNPIISLILFGISILLLPKKERWNFSYGFLGGVGINSLMKQIIRRARPNHLRLIKQGGFSYPSGHSMIAVAIFGFFMVWGIQNTKNKLGKIMIGVVGVLLILGIGFSRIYVGVHYPSDVCAGFLLSTIIQLIIHTRRSLHD